MRLLQIVKYIFFTTLLSVAYIHLHMQIIDLAYQGKTKEKQIRRLIEENGNLTYKILTMKSANNLGTEMLAEESDMEFANPDNVIEVSTPIEGLIEEQASLSTKSDKRSILSLLSFGAEAEAKTKE